MSGENGADAKVMQSECRSVGEQVESFIGSLDMRTRRSRHYAAVLDAVLTDLGGRDLASTAQVELAKRAASLSVLCSDLELAVCEGRPVDIPNLCALVSIQCRVLSRLGLRRIPRTVEPTLADLIAAGGDKAA